MKNRHADWLNLTANVQSSTATSQQPPIRLRDLPGFQEIEDKILLYSSIRGELNPELEFLINELSVKTFGIAASETFWQDPPGYEDWPLWSDERQEADSRFFEHEESFDTGRACDDEAVTILLKLGVDFRDAKGSPLLCTKFFCRQAEAAAKGVLGQMPDRLDVGLQSWANALERDARQHMTKKRTG
ncbi:hypothetical protein [Aminobacter ciceronei]|uniref:Uncharacterized protein n=1 Tax=Aminobacter ciceronei TaxID=150723 RepID=A0ABR6CF75_9HYPH|nr:hypothetical protein [Aminobacter ciceronei]MBA8909921.1 hypothetical protein [Aminobacter ciceronei]MBA9023693.1 hypothetical protein [Aminobacter ciceronei]